MEAGEILTMGVMATVHGDLALAGGTPDIGVIILAGALATDGEILIMGDIIVPLIMEGTIMVMVMGTTSLTIEEEETQIT